MLYCPPSIKMHDLIQNPSSSLQNQMNSTECTWEEEGSRKQFADFVQDFKNFSKLLNTVATE